MAAVDLRPLKNELRTKYKKLRTDMSKKEKDHKDKQIFERLVALPEFQTAETIITFVSTAIEVDTHQIIRHAWKKNKKVAVPRCIDGTRLMEFCLIKSMDDLEPRTFSVLEPKAHCKVVESFPNSFCIVPGLGFDLNGYRLGYGKGYYDRFLNHYRGTKAGVCYVNCMSPSLPHGRFDRAVDLLVTEKFCKRLQSKRKQGVKEAIHGKQKPKRS